MADPAVAKKSEAKAADNDKPEEGEAEAPARKKWSGKRIVLFIVLPVFVLAGGGSAGVYFSGILAPHAEEAAGHGEPAPAHTAIFYDLPDMLVNLNSGGKRASFLKLRVSLELGKEDDSKLLESVLPRVVDNFQVYLRELRADDLRGSAGLYRLREELLTRARLAAEPAEVRDVLFKEMLIQ